MSFAKFMASPAGRAIRAIAGVALIIIGLTSGPTWLAIVGLVPLATGALNVCMLAPMMKAPFSGKAATEV